MYLYAWRFISGRKLKALADEIAREVKYKIVSQTKRVEYRIGLFTLWKWVDSPYGRGDKIKLTKKLKKGQTSYLDLKKRTARFDSSGLEALSENDLKKLSDIFKRHGYNRRDPLHYAFWVFFGLIVTTLIMVFR